MASVSVDNNNTENIIDDIVDVSSEDEEQVDMGMLVNKLVKDIENCDPNKLKKIVELNKDVLNNLSPTGLSTDEFK